MMMMTLIPTPVKTMITSMLLMFFFIFEFFFLKNLEDAIERVYIVDICRKAYRHSIHYISRSLERIVISQ